MKNTQESDPGTSTPKVARTFVLLALGTLLLVFGTAFLFGNAPCLTVSYAGDGTAENPYEVSNVEELQCVSQNPDGHYVQVSDIDASKTASWNNGMGFEPIEGQDGSFNGTYNGAGYAITDLYVNQTDEEPMTPDSLTEVAERELFGIENLGERVALFGTVGPRGTVTNVTLVDADVEGREYVGSLVGLNYGKVTRSSATGNVSGVWFVGGLVGSNTVAEKRPRNTTVSASYGDIDVEGTVSVGGLVGENIAFGEGLGARHPRIDASYARGNVAGVEEAGGLVGLHSDGTVVGSYATGRVSEAEQTGGLVARGNGTVSASYWDLNSTNRTTSAGGTGLTTDEMTGQDARRNMDGFDFEDTWGITNSYPELSWIHEVTVDSAARTDCTEDTQVSDDWSQRDLTRTGGTPYESDDEDENILSKTGRDLVIEGGTEDHGIRVELRDDGETFYSVEGLVPANMTVTEQDTVRKRGVYEVHVYVDGNHATTFDWRVDDGHSMALVRLENGEVTTRVGKVPGALTLMQVDGHEDAPLLNETNLLEHAAVAEAFERAEDCADDPGKDGCNYFADEDSIGVQVTGIEGEELDALYRSLGSVGENNTSAYVEKDGMVYEIGVETPL